MKKSLSIYVPEAIFEALQKLAEREHRSLSNMAAQLLDQKIQELRGEYQHDQTLPSLPKQRRTSTRRWDRECREKFGG